ncbi:MAG: acyltransferase family protein [Eubacteriales bacterium]|nr:acyltransferase family protein [Eubacteriales bacterium]
MTKRSSDLDVVKGVLILLVILGHCIQFGSGQEYNTETRFFENRLYIVIYSFHMPLFVAVSGYLFAGSAQRYTPWKTLQKKAERLLLPIFSWSILYTVYQLFLMWWHGERISGQVILSEWGRQFSVSQWFLWAIFLFSIVVLIGKYWFRDSVWFYLTLYALIAWIVVPDNRFNLNTYIANYPFFMIGYFGGKQIREQRKKWDERYGKPAFWGTLAAYILLLLPKLTMQLSLSVRMDRVYYLLLGASGGAVVLKGLLFAAKRYSAKRGVRKLAETGKITLGLYVISGFLSTEVLKKATRGFSYHIGVSFLETAAVLLVSVVLIRGIQRSSILNRCLLGNRRA